MGPELSTEQGDPSYGTLLRVTVSQPQSQGFWKNSPHPPPGYGDEIVTTLMGMRHETFPPGPLSLLPGSIQRRKREAEATNEEGQRRTVEKKTTLPFPPGDTEAVG